MPDPFEALLDQNIPYLVTDWLRKLRPNWSVHHASEVGLGGMKDQQVFDWAQAKQALIITYDEDFADQRLFPVGTH